MEFLSKILADTVEAAGDALELAADIVVDTVAVPLDLGENEELFARSKEKLSDMKRKNDEN